MSNELLTVLEYIEQERGVSREILVEAIEKALMSASKKSIHPADDLIVKVDPKTGIIEAWARLEVVDSFPNTNQILLERVKEKIPDAKVGDIVEWEVTPKNFGRIAAQTAKQAISQALRRAEKENIRKEFEDRIGEIVTGTVASIENGNIIVNLSTSALNNAEGIITHKAKIPGEHYNVGDRICALLRNVDIETSGPSLFLSRSHTDFVKKLFEQEVAEIRDGVVEIMGVAREPGSRAKVAVKSNDPRVDPIGACVGMRGIRVREITTELGGERMDIVRWSENIEEYAASAIQPATPKAIKVIEEEDTIEVYVTPEESRKAFGRKAQNVRLASRLLSGWSLKIITEEVTLETVGFDEQFRETINKLSDTLSIDMELAETLVNNGYASVDVIRDASVDDLMEIDNINEETANSILEKIQELDA